MRPITVLIITLLLNGCGLLHISPQSPPPPADNAQQITRAQSINLSRLGTASVIARGSPDDAERALAEKARERGADYYLIQMVKETASPGVWYGSAIFYHATATPVPAP